MSMEYWPGHGYFLKVLDLRTLFNEKDWKEIEQAMEDREPEELYNLIRPEFEKRGWPIGFDMEIFDRMAPDFVPDLEYDTWYVAFALSDLFTLVPKTEAHRMNMSLADQKLPALQECLFTKFG